MQLLGHAALDGSDAVREALRPHLGQPHVIDHNGPTLWDILLRIKPKSKNQGVA